MRLVGHCREPLPARGFVLADADAEKDRLITGRSVRPVIGFAVSTAWVLRHVAQQFAGPAFGPPAVVRICMSVLGGRPRLRRAAARRPAIPARIK